jgi:predicted NAD/FAD-binding protein
VEVEDVHGRVEVFDRCVVGSHAPDALQMMGDGASYEERTILGAFQYSPRYCQLSSSKLVTIREVCCFSLEMGLEKLEIF